MSVIARRIRTTAVDRRAAAAIEAAEARAWADCYAAAPTDFAEAVGLGFRVDRPAYEYFPALGFTRPYVRTHWAAI
jgi:hypothetical protein